LQEIRCSRAIEWNAIENSLALAAIALASDREDCAMTLSPIVGLVEEGCRKLLFLIGINPLLSRPFSSRSQKKWSDIGTVFLSGGLYSTFIPALLHEENNSMPLVIALSGCLELFSIYNIWIIDEVS
jgi:hypothetical protein